MKTKKQRKSIKDIEVSDKHVKLRVILTIVFLIIGLSGIGYGIYNIFKTETGYLRIETNNTETDCSNDFVLCYNITSRDVESGVTLLYTQAAREMYVEFTPYELSGTVHNVHYINTHVNIDITVDDFMYDALKKVDERGLRYLYAAPLREWYSNLLTAYDDESAKYYDPLYNAEISEYINDMLEFINSDEHISFTFSENRTVRLNVSNEYLKFAEDNGIEIYVDFGVLKNAFIIDEFARRMIDSGYTDGAFSSYDGYVRNLDSGDTYAYTLYGYNASPTEVTRIVYDKPIAIVAYRAFSIGDSIYDDYYTYKNGELRNLYVSSEDGLCHNSTYSLTLCSFDTSCVDCAFEALKTFVADSVDSVYMKSLQTANECHGKISSFWFDDECIYYTDGELRFAVPTGFEPSYVE